MRPKRLVGVFDRMTRFEALRAASLKAAEGLRRRRTTAAWLADLEQNVLALQDDLLAGTWTPGPLRTFRIRDPKPRTISVAPFGDRVVHHALCAELEPMFGAFADADSYACRVGGGQWRAVRRVQSLARRHPWFARLDVAHFFETVPQRILLGRLARRVADQRAMEVVRRLLSCGTGPAGIGLPIGNLTSQHFGNFYLGALDHHLRREGRAQGLVRYMDDVVLHGLDRDTLFALVGRADAFLADHLGLRLKSRVTMVAPREVGIPFLGCRIWPAVVRLERRRAARVVRRLRRLRRDHRAGRLGDVELAARARGTWAWIGQVDAASWRRARVAEVG